MVRRSLLAAAGCGTIGWEGRGEADVAIRGASGALGLDEDGSERTG